MSTDTDWEEWGKRDPYFGVIADDRFRSPNLTEAGLKEFFESGRAHIDHVLHVARRHLDPSFSPRRALDFGCGTGRLVIPLAAIAEHVVGLDVSESMLTEARRNCDKYSVKNATLLKSDDTLSVLDGSFDFIHSFIVFQHIPVQRGKRLFVSLMDHLACGGVCAVHFTYGNTGHGRSHGKAPAQRIRDWVRRLKRPVRRMLPNRDPEVQMNSYDLDELVFLMHVAGVRTFHTECTTHVGHLGVFLFFQKPKEA